jgi:hypothetical protein
VVRDRGRVRPERPTRRRRRVKQRSAGDCQTIADL